MLYQGKYRGRAIAQAVSRWLPIAAARVRSRVWSSGICGGQSGAGAGFLRVLRFPLPIFIPPIAPQSPSPIIWGWYNRSEVAAVQIDGIDGICKILGFSLTHKSAVITICTTFFNSLSGGWSPTGSTQHGSHCIGLL
jgi:hypothetical protein